MVRILRIANMGPAFVHMNANMAGHAIVRYVVISMGHPMHAGRNPVPSDIQDNRPAIPAPPAPNLPDLVGISFGNGLRIGMIGPTGPFHVKRYPRVQIRYLGDSSPREQILSGLEPIHHGTEGGSAAP